MTTNTSTKATTKTEAPLSKAEKIAKVQANLPLPEDPPVASDWNSADARPVSGAGKPVDQRQYERKSGTESKTKIGGS